MASFNKVILIGNLTADPEINQTPSGVAVAKFSIAVGRRFSKDGEQNADFINIVAWRQTAEFVKRYFNKGKSILVCGQLQSRSWTDKDGNKRSTLEVVADEVSFVDKKAQEPAQQSYVGEQNAPYQADMNGFEAMTDDEILPF